MVKSREELRDLLRALGEALGNTPPGLRRSILDWLRNCAAGVGFGIQTLPESGEEVKSMLSERIQEWSKELREEGRVEGRLEAQLRLLKEQLQYLTELKYGRETWEVLSGSVLAMEDPDSLAALFKEALSTTSPDELIALIQP